MREAILSQGKDTTTLRKNKIESKAAALYHLQNDQLLTENY